MKQLTTFILGNAVLLLVLSCQTVDLSKKYPNMVADMDPLSVGTFDVQSDRFFSTKVRKSQFEAVFYPRLNSVSLEFKIDLTSYRQFWDEPARKQFAAALELYKKDFEEGKLANNNKRTRSVYGSVKGRAEWSITQYSKTRVSNPKIEIGYQFKENTPFFSIFMRPAKEIVSGEDDSNATYSQQFNMYFTRAQADVLVGIFDQARLLELIGKKINPVTGEFAEDDVPRDIYDEYLP